VTAIGRFLDLSWTERRLLMAAGVAVPVLRLGLWLLPFGVFRPLVIRGAARRPGPGLDGKAVDQVAWAVSVVARRIPGATCLTQALAARVLLAGMGERSELRIGVLRECGGGIRAHAWLEHDGRVVIGGDAGTGYAVLSSAQESAAVMTARGG